MAGVALSVAAAAQPCPLRAASGSAVAGRARAGQTEATTTGGGSAVAGVAPSLAVAAQPVEVTGNSWGTCRYGGIWCICARREFGNTAVGGADGGADALDVDDVVGSSNGAVDRNDGAGSANGAADVSMPRVLFSKNMIRGGRWWAYAVVESLGASYDAHRP